MNSNFSRIVIFGIFCVVLACSSGATFAAPTDACSLLTQDQVSTILGVKVGAGKSSLAKICEWTAEGQSGPKAIKVTVTIQTPPAFAYAKAPAANGITKTPVSGVGDDAISGTMPNVATTLTVKKGDFYFAVHIYPYSDGDDIKTKEKNIALKILAAQ